MDLLEIEDTDSIEMQTFLFAKIGTSNADIRELANDAVGLNIQESICLGTLGGSL